MRKGLLGSLAALLVGGGVGLAQTPTQTVANALGAPEMTGQKLPAPAPAPPPTASSGVFMANGPACPLSWGDASYLLWRFSNAPLPVPLVTTSLPADFGILGNPSTQVLAGGSSYSGGWQSGYQLTAGKWFNDERLVGIEASGFYFQPRNTTVFAGGTSDPKQVLAIPFNNVTPGGTNGAVPGAVTGGLNANLLKTANGQSALLLSGTTNVGSAAVTSNSSFWGTEINGVLNLRRTENGQINAIFGVRYLDLLENLNLDAISNFSSPLAGPFVASNFHDHFGTRNQVYSGQLGLKGEWTDGTFFVNATGKVALGVNHETVDVIGTFNDQLGFLYRTFGTGTASSGGVFTARSNIGTQNQNQFIVVPEVGLQAGVNITRNIRVFTGYDAVYLSNVVRPGNQIDRNVNLTQVGTGVGGGNGQVPNLVGPANPAAQFNQSSFWAQGVNFGLEFKY